MGPARRKVGAKAYAAHRKLTPHNRAMKAQARVGAKKTARVTGRVSGTAARKAKANYREGRSMVKKVSTSRGRKAIKTKVRKRSLRASAVAGRKSGIAARKARKQYNRQRNIVKSKVRVTKARARKTTYGRTLRRQKGIQKASATRRRRAAMGRTTTASKSIINPGNLSPLQRLGAYGDPRGPRTTKNTTNSFANRRNAISKARTKGRVGRKRY